ncbi:MAG: prepilin-type N-terminal cleavage/methylation domain-containing protein [Candidatus Omnitrophica bacterium]|nr:prepilin-type N-terminal cleavage/methylation domain-containing protein [Candidatus Omnitrophota bacterium]MCB9748238.1 prepilin-type N-terminal cleavage/methylation domain-containing protein [Candidatus Omnitrophota bacterium]
MKNKDLIFSKLTQKGFTLVEVIIAIALIGIIGSASWFGISAITQSEIMTGNRVGVVNLIQRSQEEVRAAAQSLFDTIQLCDYEGSAPCGFDNSILSEYPDVTERTLVITETQGSELKTVRISVEWQERGILRQLDSITYLARPPDPLPGSLVGVVRRSNGGQPLSGVSIQLTFLSTSESISESSKSTVVITANGNSANYDFGDDINGKFRLKPGKWKIKATKSSYKAFTNNGQAIDIAPGEENVLNFIMQFSPVPPPVCGDGKCKSPETCSSCVADCGVCPPPPVCGNGKCEKGEGCGSCAADCGACPPPPVCGDGKCQSPEKCETCAADCGACPPPPGAWLMDKCDEKLSTI